MPRRQVMKPYQVNLVAAAMFGDAEKILDAVETRLAGEIVCHILHSDRLDRVDDDVTVVHLVTIDRP